MIGKPLLYLRRRGPRVESEICKLHDQRLSVLEREMAEMRGILSQLSINVASLTTVMTPIPQHLKDLTDAIKEQGKAAHNTISLKAMALGAAVVLALVFGIAAVKHNFPGAFIP